MQNVRKGLTNDRKDVILMVCLTVAGLFGVIVIQPLATYSDASTFWYAYTLPLSLVLAGFYVAWTNTHRTTVIGKRCISAYELKVKDGQGQQWWISVGYRMYRDHDVGSIYYGQQL